MGLVGKLDLTLHHMETTTHFKKELPLCFLDSWFQKINNESSKHHPTTPRQWWWWYWHQGWYCIHGFCQKNPWPQFLSQKKYAYFMTFANLRQKWNGIKEMRSTFFHSLLFISIFLHIFILIWITQKVRKLLRKYTNLFVVFWKKLRHQENNITTAGRDESHVCWQAINNKSFALVG